MRPIITVGDLAAIPFGASVTKFNNLIKSKPKDGLVWCERLGDEKIVDGFPVTFISYGFEKDRLSEVRIFLIRPSVQGLRKVIETKYGSKLKRGGVAGGYIWKDNRANISFQIYCSFNEGFMAYLSAKPLG